MLKPTYIKIYVFEALQVLLFILPIFISKKMPVINQTSY